MFRKRRQTDPYADVGPAARAEIIRATLDGDDPTFHGGCAGCIFQLQAKTHEGIRYCMGCRYMNYRRDLPDLSWSEYTYRDEIEQHRYHRSPKP